MGVRETFAVLSRTLRHVGHRNRGLHESWNQAFHAMISFTTFPFTSVSRKSRPA